MWIVRLTSRHQWCTDIETNGILDTCKELGVAIAAYSPLGRGMLTGQIKSHDDISDGDFRKYNPRFSKENFPKVCLLGYEIEQSLSRHRTLSLWKKSSKSLLRKDAHPASSP